jgi:hypothetical protein
VVLRRARETEEASVGGSVHLGAPLIRSASTLCPSAFTGGGAARGVADVDTQLAAAASVNSSEGSSKKTGRRVGRI